ncbi:MAG: hypothetical protein C0609_04865 [Deltaproteobacteria bacterium]|nr:MAG: hypothetical protein C0609_04865 [Deltaproteobacteria bacterium]
MDQWVERASERVNISLPVTVCTGRTSTIEGQILKTKDISDCGAFIISPAILPVGSDVFIRVLLPTGRRVVAKGLVWRSATNGFGVKFDHKCEELEEEFGPNLTRAGYYKSHKLLNKRKR